MIILIYCRKSTELFLVFSIFACPERSRRDHNPTKIDHFSCLCAFYEARPVKPEICLIGSTFYPSFHEGSQPFARGLIQLIRQRLFLVTSSRPKARTKLLSCQSTQTSNLPTGQITPNFQISKIWLWRLGDEKIKFFTPHIFHSQL